MNHGVTNLVIIGRISTMESKSFWFKKEMSLKVVLGKSDPIYSITTCAAYIIGPTCRKIPTENSPKLDAAYNKYYKSLYSNGCQPVVVGKYTHLLSDKMLKPALNDISHNLKMQPNHRKSLLRITDKSTKAFEANCGQITKEVDFCKNTKAFPKYTECTKDQILSVVISHTQKAGPLLNKNAYRKR